MADFNKVLASSPPMQPASLAEPPLYRRPQLLVDHLSAAADLGREYQAALFAQCATGIHVGKREYGPAGIITSVLLFPIGLVCLYVDSTKRCTRCGARMS